MKASRRSFLKHIAGVTAMTIGATEFAGCLGDRGRDPPPASSQATQSDPPTIGTAGPTAPSQRASIAPVWQPSPTIEFIEGVPAVVDVRQFVLDPWQDPLVISLKSGVLPPGITWDPSKATIAYDGRPLGARPNTPVVLMGVTFVADNLG